MGYLIPFLHEVTEFCFCLTRDIVLTSKLEMNFHVSLLSYLLPK